MSDSEGGSDRPIADGVEGLTDAAEYAIRQGTEDVGDNLSGNLAKIQRLIDVARRHVSPAELPDLQAAHRHMQRDLQHLGSDVSAALSSLAGELDALRRRNEVPALERSGASTTTGASAATDRAEDTVAAVSDALAYAHPEVAALVARLVADAGHPLDLTRSLRDPELRAGTLAILAELAEGRALAGRGLGEYLAERPGRGPLFAPVPDEALTTADGRSRKELFVAEAVTLDPARDVGADPTPEERVLLDDYVRRLVEHAEPRVRAEVAELAEGSPGATVSTRVKDPNGLLDKVERMSSGGVNRPARAGYRVGDILDVVGARISVANTTELAALTAAVVERYGIGDGGRVLDWENRYTEPKPHNPAYRVVPFILSVRVDGLPYPFELQLTTHRASVAADLEHNTVYKPYVPVSDREQDRVRRMQAEAAALDQDETRSDAR